MKFVEGGVCAAKGFKANGIHCGLRKNHIKKDLSLIVSDTMCNAAAVYTTNLVKGAPITVTKENLADGKAPNSGFSSPCTPFADPLCSRDENGRTTKLKVLHF